MMAPADGLSNELPDAQAAVLIHLAHVAATAEQRAKAARRMAERQAESAGVPIAGLRRARRLVTADPDRMERQERETAMVLRWARAAVQVMQPSLFEMTTDESDVSRDGRLHDEGYSAAIWCGQRDGGGYREPEDRDAWLAGFDAFTADLAAYEAQRARPARQKAVASC